ncbi:hypothetical protein ACFSUS_09170 [Spirosoma soli]|uniref:DUF4175 domain-containing protein n=1 Tax=Spirosoma soli TaxID=1770529 RepID=A0ABW5M3U3_9BACT
MATSTMNRTAAYLLGPELVWVLMFILTSVIIALYRPLADADHEKLLNYGWFLPTLGVLLAFVSLFWAPGSPWWWLLRITFASLVGILLVVSFLCDSARYNDSRDAGIGTGYMVFVGLGCMVLLGIAFVAGLCFVARWSFLPVLKWTLILFGLFLSFCGLMAWLSSLDTDKAS